MIEITGNTYAVREKLKALGARWSAARKCWVIAEDKADAARALVPASSAKSRGRATRTCATCGCRINYGVYCGKCEYR